MKKGRWKKDIQRRRENEWGSEKGGARKQKDIREKKTKERRKKEGRSE